MKNRIQLGDHDPLDYFPLYEGMKPSSAVMKKLPIYENTEKNKIFQIDEKWDIFRASKEECRKERLDKYYQTKGFHDKDVLKHIIETLLKEYPQHFTLHQYPKSNILKNCVLSSVFNVLECKLSNELIGFDDDYKLVFGGFKTELEIPFVDLFDALAMQVSEDMVIYRQDGESHFTSQVHLCHANGWSAEWAVGQDFSYIHEGVPRIKEIIPKPEAMVKGLFRLPQPIERVGAISFRTDTILNRHPEVPENMMHKAFDEITNPYLFMRVERQTVTSFPNIPAFLFTIKTYFVDCKNHDEAKKNAVIESFTNLNSKAYKYDWMKENQAQVLRWLKK